MLKISEEQLASLERDYPGIIADQIRRFEQRGTAAVPGVRLRGHGERAGGDHRSHDEDRRGDHQFQVDREWTEARELLLQFV